jgi:hypothetical protein
VRASFRRPALRRALSDLNSAIFSFGIMPFKHNIAVLQLSIAL